MHCIVVQWDGKLKHVYLMNEYLEAILIGNKTGKYVCMVCSMTYLVSAFQVKKHQNPAAEVEEEEEEKEEEGMEEDEGGWGVCYSCAQSLIIAT